MSNLYQEILRGILLQHGLRVCEDPKIVKGSFRDYLGNQPGDHDKWVNAILAALGERLPQDLSNPGDRPADVVRWQAVARLQKAHSMELTMAQWAVETWMYALGKEGSFSRSGQTATPEPATTLRQAPGVQTPDIAMMAGTPTAVLHSSAAPVRGNRRWLWALLPLALVVLVVGGLVLAYTELIGKGPSNAVSRMPPGLDLTLPGVVNVKAGGTTSFEVRLRRTAIEGPIQVSFDNTPGILRIEPVTIAAGTDTIQVTVKVGKDAVGGNKEIQVIARIGEVSTTRILKLNVEKPTLELQAARQLNVKPGDRKGLLVRIIRNGLEEPVALMYEGVPEGVIIKETTIPPPETETKLEFLVSADAPEADRDIKIIGLSGSVRQEVLVRISIKPWPFEGKVQEYIPDDSEFILGVNLRQFLDSPLGRKHFRHEISQILSKAQDGELRAALGGLGFDLSKDIAGVVLAARPWVRDGKELPGLVFSVLGSFDPAKVEAALETNLGFRLARMPDGHGGEYRVLIKANSEAGTSSSIYASVNQRTIVLALKESDLIGCLNKQAGWRKMQLENSRVQALLEEVEAKQTAWIILLGTSLIKNGRTAQDEFGLDALTGGMTISDAIDVDLVATAKDAVSARKVTELLQQELGDLLAPAALSVTLLGPFLKLVETSQITNTGNTSYIKGHLSEAAVAQAIMKAQSQVTNSIRNAETKTKATKVYAVIIVDDKDPTIGNDAALSAKQLENILNAQFDESQRQVTILRSSDRLDHIFTRDYLLKEALPDLLKDVKKDESVFCYYLGGGGSIHQAGLLKAGGYHHYLDLQGSRPDFDARVVLEREEIWRLLDNTGAQLKVLITDACATYLRIREPGLAPAASPAGAGAARKAGTLPSLLLGHMGKVDINSCSQNENAYYVRNLGGLFTSVFTEMAELPRQNYTWEEDAKSYLTRRTKEDYEDLRTRQLASADTSVQTKRDFRKQPAQTVRFFILEAK